MPFKSGSVYFSPWTYKLLTLVYYSGRAYTRVDRRHNRSERSSRRPSPRQSPRWSPRVYTTGDRRGDEHLLNRTTNWRSSRRQSPVVYTRGDHRGAAYTRGDCRGDRRGALLGVGLKPMTYASETGDINLLSLTIFCLYNFVHSSWSIVHSYTCLS